MFVLFIDNVNTSDSLPQIIHRVSMKGELGKRGKRT